MRPTILLFNGPSSSGKTTVGRCLQRVASDLWLLLSLDSFLEMFPPTMGQDWPPFSTLSGAYYRTALVWAEAGYNLIIDTVIDENDSFIQCAQALARFNACTVGFHCSVEELSRREALRGDRESGLAKRQFDRVHRLVPYDLELDTASMSIEACADKILKLLNNPPSPTALVALQSQANRAD